MTKSRMLLDQLSGLAQSVGGELSWFVEKMQNLDEIDVTPAQLPVCTLLPDATNLASDQTLSTVRTVINAAPDLRWQQSYTVSDGFSRDYLDNYGWFNLVSPEGVFTSDLIRISFGYWNSGLNYLEHWHEPEEFYLVLAGQARFLSQGRTPRLCGPGDIVHHPSNLPHSIEMDPGPLLVAAFWRGNRLLDKPGLDKS